MLLFLCGLEIGRHVAPWDYECVATVYREPVEEGQCQLVFGDYVGFGDVAEDAFRQRYQSFALVFEPAAEVVDPSELQYIADMRRQGGA